MVKSDDFQECKGILRFRVPTGDGSVEAFLSQTTCETALRQAPGVGSLAAFYRQNRSVLDGIVLGKVGSGARQPVVVMVRDLQPQSLDHSAQQWSGFTASHATQRDLPDSSAS